MTPSTSSHSETATVQGERCSRRRFLRQSSAGVAGALTAGLPLERRVHAAGSDTIQIAFLKALRAGDVIDNADYMAKSTLMAIMARASAYTGQSLTWEQILNSQEALSPSAYAWDAAPPPAEVAVPGVTPFI